MNIVLIGYRGSGKSSIGKRLASLLWMDFVDTDALIVADASKSIREIFEAEGEEGFRNRETAAIKLAATKDNQIIALGGGAILRPENIAALKTGAKVIWLKADPATLHARIQADVETNASRPNLTAAGGIDEIRQLLEQRTPLYQAAADTSLEVTYLSVEDAAQRLVTMI